MLRIIRASLLTVLAVFLLAAAVRSQPPTTSGGSGWALLNLDNTVALHGHDPVTYFSTGSLPGATVSSS